MPTTPNKTKTSKSNSSATTGQTAQQGVAVVGGMPLPQLAALLNMPQVADVAGLQAAVVPKYMTAQEFADAAADNSMGAIGIFSRMNASPNDPISTPIEGSSGGSPGDQAQLYQALAQLMGGLAKGPIDASVSFDGAKVSFAGGRRPRPQAKPASTAGGLQQPQPSGGTQQPQQTPQTQPTQQTPASPTRSQKAAQAASGLGLRTAKLGAGAYTAADLFGQIADPYSVATRLGIRQSDQEREQDVAREIIRQLAPGMMPDPWGVNQNPASQQGAYDERLLRKLEQQ